MAWLASWAWLAAVDGLAPSASLGDWIGCPGWLGEAWLASAAGWADQNCKISGRVQNFFGSFGNFDPGVAAMYGLTWLAIGWLGWRALLAGPA